MKKQTAVGASNSLIWQRRAATEQLPTLSQPLQASGSLLPVDTVFIARRDPCSSSLHIVKYMLSVVRPAVVRINVPSIVCDRENVALNALSPSRSLLATTTGIYLPSRAR